ncbi:response regulator transcription factor [Chloroflexota bacterium]
MKKIKLLIVDDLEHVRQGLNTRLTLSEEIEIIGEAGNGFEAIGMALVFNPDVILMDYEMPKLNGIEATKIVKNHNPDIHIVMISIYDTEEIRRKAIEAGVAVYVNKATPVDELINQIRPVVK